MFSGGQTFFLRYLCWQQHLRLLDMAGWRYSLRGAWPAATTALYLQNPEKQLRGGSKNAVAMRAIRLTNCSILRFPYRSIHPSPERPICCGYDIFQQRLSNYKESAPWTPLKHTQPGWMDIGWCLLVAALLLHDFDQTNLQTPVAAARFCPRLWSRLSLCIYACPILAALQLQTPLLIPADL